MTVAADLELIEHASLEQLERIVELREWEKIERALDTASPKQLAFRKAFLARQDEAGRKCSKFIAIGGNRAGKTWLTCRLCFATYLRDIARAGDHFWAGSQNLDRSIAGLQKELWEALPAGLFAGRIWEPKNGFGGNRTVLVRVKDGGFATIEFRSADQDPNTFETAKLRGVIWDENLPESLYNRLLPRLIDLQGFFLYSDINNQAWPIDRLEEAPPDAGVYYKNFSMYDNAANLPPGAIEEFAAGIPQDEIDLRVHGKPGAMEGVVFKQYRDQAPHVVDDFPIPVEPFEWPKFLKIDFGETAPTAASWSTVAPNEHIYVYREHYEKEKSVFANAKMIHDRCGNRYHIAQCGADEIHENPWTQIVVDEWGEKYAKIYLDPKCFGDDNGSRVTVAQEYRDAGFPVERWPRVEKMGEHAMVAKFKYRLERNTWHVFKSCTNMRREMRIWKHKLDKDGKPVAADAYDNKNNHLIDGQKGFIADNPTYSQSEVKVYNNP